MGHHPCQADSITTGAAADALPWAWGLRYLDAGLNVVAANAALGLRDAPESLGPWKNGGKVVNHQEIASYFIG